MFCFCKHFFVVVVWSEILFIGIYEFWNFFVSIELLILIELFCKLHFGLLLGECVSVCVYAFVCVFESVCCCCVNRILLMSPDTCTIYLIFSIFVIIFENFFLFLIFALNKINCNFHCQRCKFWLLKTTKHFSFILFAFAIFSLAKILL